MTNTSVRPFFRILASHLLALSVLAVMGVAAEAGVRINEVMASNAETLADEDGDYEDWIELYNTGDSTVNLAGWGISDDYERPFRWVFGEVSLAPGEFLLIWASGKDRDDTGSPLHTNFRIASAGEEVILTDPAGNRIDELSPREIPTDISVGRQPDGSGPWQYFTEPTPGESNTTEGFERLAAPPEFSRPGGLHQEGFHLEITSANEDAVIYYTLDGSAPDPDNLGGRTYQVMNEYPDGPLLDHSFQTHIYESPISVSSREGDANHISEITTAFNGFFRPGTEWEPPAGEIFKATVVRAKAVVPEAVPSAVATRTYFVDEEIEDRYSLPVISIATTEDRLFDFVEGVYVPGQAFNTWKLRNPNAPVNGSTPANYLRRGPRWELPAHIEFYEPGGELAFAQDVGVRIHGGWSRANRQKALRIFARNAYDDESSMQHEIFPGHRQQGGEEILNDFKRLILHVSGQDNGLTMFRDAMAQSLIAHTGIDTQAYRPSILFLNGEYWGIQNIRERYDHHYVATNYDVGPGEVVVLQRNSEIVAGEPGDQQHYNNLVDYVAARASDGTIDQPSVYGEIENRMDIDNFIHHYAAQIYYANIDWPAGNLRWWRYKGEPDSEHYGQDGKWRWMMYDTDHGFGLFVTEGWGGWRIESDHNTVAHATGTGDILWSNPDWATRLFRSLLQSNRFRNRFLNAFSDHLNSSFKAERVVERIDEMQAAIAPEYPEFAHRWNQPATFWHGGDTWEEKVEVMRDFARTRVPYVREHLRSYFGISDTVEVTLDRNGRGGRIQVNTLVLESNGIGMGEEPYPWSGTYFRSVPVRLTALPHPGHRFAGWVSESGSVVSNNPSATLEFTRDTILTATFEPDGSLEFDPEPHSLGDGPYSFTSWPAGSEAGTYPPHMIFEQTANGDPGLGQEMDSYWVLPYNLESRSRINGLGDDGFGFINTSNAQDHPEAGYLGSALLALDTSGQEEIRVTWRGGTVRPNSRVYNLRLQYRIGDEGPFTDVDDGDGNAVEYVRNENAGHTEVLGPVLLPVDAEDRPLVQLRWKYYHTGVRLDPDSGQRSKLRVDEILVSSGGEPAGHELVFKEFHPAGQAGKPLVPVTVAALNPDGTTDLAFDGEITISVEQGPGGISGTITRLASGGQAVFDDLILDTHGKYRLRVEAEGAEAIASSPLRAAAVTEVIMPRYLQGARPDNNDRVPFAYRLTLEGLLPDATYRYGNRVEEPGEPPMQDGAGNSILVRRDGSPFVRNTDAPDFAHGELNVRHAEFTTDSSGSYTGWFVTEPTGNRRFVPGEKLRMRILLNDGSLGEDYHFFLSTDSPVEVREFGSASHQGSALYGEAQLGPRSFIHLYDNPDGEGRPLAGTVVEGTGAETDSRYASFYLGQVVGWDGTWGTLIPNDLAAGVLRIEERSLLTGELLEVTVLDDPLSGTVQAEHGRVPVYAELREGAVFLPQGDGDWMSDQNWSGGVTPDAAGAKAIVHLTTDNDRAVNVGGRPALGRLILNNDTGSRNRIAGEGGLDFQGDGSNALLVAGGAGTGFSEFRMDNGITLAGDLRVAVNNINPIGEYGALRIREGVDGPGGLVKEGPGVLSLTGGGKDFTGPTVVSGGVLRVTESSAPGATSEVRVNSGGQLRLVSHGDRSYSFGGAIVLDSFGPNESGLALPQAGRLGGLRLDPELEIRDSEEASHAGTVANDIVFAGDSHVHVDGTANRLILSGALAGEGKLLKSGGGALVLTEPNTHYPGGTHLMTGSIFVEPGSALGTGPLQLEARGNAEVDLFLNNSIQNVSRLEGDLDGGGAATIALGQDHLLVVDQDDDSRYQGSLTGSGSLLKRGDGILRLTRGPNSFLGTLTVESGVLEITESSQPASASGVSVGDGAQLRLTSTGERAYTLGTGDVTLHGTGTSSSFSASKGVLRQDAGNPSDTAVLHNNVVLHGDRVGVHANRDEADGSSLTLAGELSGAAELLKTGGGTLVVEGENALLAGGTVIENGVLVVRAGSRIGGGSLAFIDPDRSRRLELHNAGQTIGGLSGAVEGAGGSLEVFLGAGHYLTIAQAVDGVFTGAFEGPGNLIKTGLSRLVLDGDSSMTGTLAVEGGVLSVDGSLASSASARVEAGGNLEGSGRVPALGGGGRVVPGRDGPGILEAHSLDPADGLGAAFTFTQNGSPQYAERTDSRNAVLRLASAIPFESDLNAENTVEIYLDVPGLFAGQEFRGGFFAESGEASALADAVRNANFRFFLRDTEGNTGHRGISYRAYSGPLAASVDAVTENGGVVMRITWSDGPSFAAWQEAHFPDTEDRDDPDIGGPYADPNGDGASNLLKYALGLGPAEQITPERFAVEMDASGRPVVRFHRDPAKTDIAYVVDVSPDMSAWSEIVFDSREFGGTNSDGELHEVLISPDADSVPIRFARLRIIRLED